MFARAEASLPSLRHDDCNRTPMMTRKWRWRRKTMSAAAAVLAAMCFGLGAFGGALSLGSPRVIAMAAAAQSSPTKGSDNPHAPSKFAVFGYLTEARYSTATTSGETADGGSDGTTTITANSSTVTTTPFDYEAAFKTGLTHLIYYSGVHVSAAHLPKGLEKMPSKEEVGRARAAAEKYASYASSASHDHNNADASTGTSSGKLLLCIGGSALNKGFSTMVETDTAREKFLTALDELLREYSFDGVDFRWEYPLTHTEWANYRDFLAQSKDMLLDGEAIITATLGFSRQHMKEVKETDIVSYVDYLHFLAYDQRDRHSTLAFAEQVVKMITVKGDLGENIKSKNAIGRKVTLGLPFYGRQRNGASTKQYNEIVPVLKKQFLAAAVEEQKRKKGKGVTATAGGSSGGALLNAVNLMPAVEAKILATDELSRVYWNSATIIAEKVQLAKSSGLGGVVVWELGMDMQPCDDSLSLMWAVKEGLTGLNRSALIPQLGGKAAGSEDASAAGSGVPIDASSTNSDL